MKNEMSKHAKVLSTLALFALIVTGVFTLATDASARRPPGPLCGFTTIWDCTLRDGSVVQVIGTQCDIAKFERRNKATCVPASF